MKSLKIILVLVFCFGLVQISFGQPDTLWTRTYTAGGGIDVIETIDNKYIVVGGSGYEQKLILLKADEIGDTLWAKKYGGNGIWLPSNVQQTSDSGFVIVGYTSDSEQGDLWMMKTDFNGDSLWVKIYGFNNINGSTYVEQTSDSGFIVVGTSMYNNLGIADIRLIRTNSNGDTIWTRTYGGVYPDFESFIQETSDSGYILYGNGLFIKTDSNGDTLWTKSFTDSLDMVLCGSVLEIYDGYILAVSNENGYLIKTDFGGNIVWKKHLLYCTQETYHYFNSISLTDEGGYLICGNSKTISLIPDFNYGWIMLIDAEGNILWEKNLVEGLIQYVGTSLNSAIQTSDGSYLATGYNFGYLFLAKVEEDKTNIENSKSIKINNFSLSQNYPNPFNPSTTIEFTLPKSENVKLKVFNILGKEVSTLVTKKLQQGNHTYTFDGQNLASGVYYYQLGAGDFREVKKMILLR